MWFVNESAVDRIIRILVAMALGYAAWTAWPATIAIAYGLLGAIAFFTGAVGWCPMYDAFEISTKKKTHA